MINRLEWAAKADRIQILSHWKSACEALSGDLAGSRVLGVLAFAAALSIGLEPVAAEEDEFEVMDEIPSSILTSRDDHGTNWIVLRSGQIADAGTKLFQHGMVLNISRTDFNPKKGLASGKHRRWMLSQKVGDVVVVRDVYFDPERGGVRYLDTFMNTTDKEVQVEAEYRNAFRSPWSKIHTAQGRPFEGKLASRDSGIYVKMPSERGHLGVLFLVSGERGQLKPDIEIKNNDVLLRYSLAVPPKSKLSVVQWVAQRRIVQPTEVRDLTAEFYRQRMLADALIPKELRETITNFQAGGADGGDVEPHNGPLLVALGVVSERVGVIRTGHDVLWVAKESQLGGTVEGGDLSGSSRFGEFSIPIDEVAALRGGGGRGRDPRVFLRDGSVLQAEVSLDGLKLAGTDGWLLDLDVTQVEYLFMRISEEDGLVSSNCDLFLEFHSGDVCGVVAGIKDRLEFMTPWGAFEVPMREIESMSYLQDPSPRYRVRLVDGSRITAFLMEAGMTMKAQRFGEVKLKTSELSGMWSVRGEVPDRITSIEEIDDVSETSIPVCLLKGDNLIAGRLADEEIHVVSGTTVTALKSAEINSMSRSYEDGSEMIPVFEIELKGGDLLLGSLREDTVRVVGEHLNWSVPVSHFLAMQTPVAED